MNKFLVLTTINDPTKAIKNFARFKDWNIVVVGDQKTPKDWRFKGVRYLSIEYQQELFPEFSKLVPLNSYSRKNIGYLYAMKNGAELIGESDDDNYPLQDWGQLPVANTYKTICGEGFVNMYKYYTKLKIWPRGLPLDTINHEIKFKIKKKNKNVGVWQFLADKQPDVDAIYRLTNNAEVRFKNGGNYVLDKNVLCPFNSQNTFFTKKLFTLMYLPGFVTMRATDIFRGLIAQPIMWNSDFFLGFGKPTVYQDRNPHNYMNDFESEIPVYKFAGKIPEIIRDSISGKASLGDNLLKGYRCLVKMKLLQKEEIKNLDSWLNVVCRYVN